MLAASPNRELELLVKRLNLRALLADEEASWSVSFVFVTNAELDAAGISYLTTTRDELPPLSVWDRAQLVPIARRTERPGLLDLDFILPANSEVLVEPLDDDVQMAVALVAANELVRLPGIDDLTLFALNVRLGLGRTKINRELASTINEETSNHGLFPAYHNGITILTNELKVDEDGLQLKGVTVVNGCQSLLALHANRGSLTPDLNLLVKAVQLNDSTTLADTITYRSNNQNAVNIRDQRANDPIQRDLQRQVTEHYGSELFFAIRRGEQSPGDVEVLENQDAAQLIMAIWLKEPWAAVRKLKLFDEEYRRIFGRGIDAHKLLLAHRLSQMVNERRGDLRASLSTSFASVRSTIVYLTAAVAHENDLGTALFDDPGRWLPDEEDKVLAKLGELMDHVVTELNNYAQAREEAQEADPNASVFDAKIAFKSQASIRLIEQPTMSLTRALARRIDDFLFDVAPVR